MKLTLGPITCTVQVDERAVLKHFDWPESKADALREAAFEYQDLKKLCYDITSFEDDPRIPTDSALKKMLAMLEKYVISFCTDDCGSYLNTIS
jgi:hypothetical protein